MCDYCANTYTRKNSLLYHINIGHENKDNVNPKKIQHNPVDCNICGTPYACKENLLTHMNNEHMIVYNQGYMIEYNNNSKPK